MSILVANGGQFGNEIKVQMIMLTDFGVSLPWLMLCEMLNRSHTVSVLYKIE